MRRFGDHGDVRELDCEEPAMSDYAFPQPHEWTIAGLTKREYFAAKAMQAIAQGIHGDTESRMQMLRFSQDEKDSDTCQTVAELAVEYADALILALNEKGGNA